MRDLKKVLALVIVMATVFSMMIPFAPTVTAAATDTNIYPDVTTSTNFNKAIKFLKEINLMRGDDQGNFRPDGKLTRAEIAVLLFIIDTGMTDTAEIEKTWGYLRKQPSFVDVAPDAWYTVYVNYLAGRNVISGKPQLDGTLLYDPNATLTYRDFLVLVVRFIDGAQEHQFTQYDLGYHFVAKNKGLLKNDAANPTEWIEKDADWEITRGYVAQIMFNTLGQNRIGTQNGGKEDLSTNLMYNRFGYKQINGVVYEKSATEIKISYLQYDLKADFTIDHRISFTDFHRGVREATINEGSSYYSYLKDLEVGQYFDIQVRNMNTKMNKDTAGVNSADIIVANTFKKYDAKLRWNETGFQYEDAQEHGFRRKGDNNNNWFRKSSQGADGNAVMLYNGTFVGGGDGNRFNRGEADDSNGLRVTFGQRNGVTVTIYSHPDQGNEAKADNKYPFFIQIKNYGLSVVSRITDTQVVLTNVGDKTYTIGNDIFIDGAKPVLGEFVSVYVDRANGNKLTIKKLETATARVASSEGTDGNANSYDFDGIGRKWVADDGVAFNGKVGGNNAWLLGNNGSLGTDRTTIKSFITDNRGNSVNLLFFNGWIINAVKSDTKVNLWLSLPGVDVGTDSEVLATGNYVYAPAWWDNVPESVRNNVTFLWPSSVTSGTYRFASLTGTRKVSSSKVEATYETRVMTFNKANEATVNASAYNTATLDFTKSSFTFAKVDSLKDDKKTEWDGLVCIGGADAYLEIVEYNSGSRTIVYKKYEVLSEDLIRETISTAKWNPSGTIKVDSKDVAAVKFDYDVKEQVYYGTIERSSATSTTATYFVRKLNLPIEGGVYSMENNIAKLVGDTREEFETKTAKGKGEALLASNFATAADRGASCALILDGMKNGVENADMVAPVTTDTLITDDSSVVEYTSKNGCLKIDGEPYYLLQNSTVFIRFTQATSNDDYPNQMYRYTGANLGNMALNLVKNTNVHIVFAKDKDGNVIEDIIDVIVMELDGKPIVPTSSSIDAKSKYEGVAYLAFSIGVFNKDDNYVPQGTARIQTGNVNFTDPNLICASSVTGTWNKYTSGVNGYYNVVIDSSGYISYVSSVGNPDQTKGGSGADKDDLVNKVTSLTAMNGSIFTGYYRCKLSGGYDGTVIFNDDTKFFDKGNGAVTRQYAYNMYSSGRELRLVLDGDGNVLVAKVMNP